MPGIQGVDREGYRSDGVEEMSEPRDPGIKLFGRTIPLPESQTTVVPPPQEKGICGEITEAEAEVSISDVGDNTNQFVSGSSSCLTNRSDGNHHNSTCDVTEMQDLKPEQDETEAEATNQEKTLKKPDKVLPCPRCKSMDTKFCYYNNYNVNQPRHFCKNCQRYWTAGGTMRNVPVGAGRRKNKQSASQYRQLMVQSDGLPSSRVDSGYSINHQAVSGGSSAQVRPLHGNGADLKPGPEGRLCESMASVLNLGDIKRSAEKSPIACEENMEKPSCGSSLTASDCMEYDSPSTAAPIHQDYKHACSDASLSMPNSQSYPLWADAWALSWNNIATMAGRCSSELVYRPEIGQANSVPWTPLPLVANPAYRAPSIPFPFVPAPFWGCIPSWPNGTCFAPWVGSNGCLPPPSSASNSECSGNGSPTLGKHSRDEKLAQEKEEKSLWVPKTLRIDDPDDAAKSSIWATLGIRPDEKHIKSGGVFKAFQAKTGSKGKIPEADHILHANPAALSRSQTFQENT